MSGYSASSEGPTRDETLDPPITIVTPGARRLSSLASARFAKSCPKFVVRPTTSQAASSAATWATCSEIAAKITSNVSSQSSPASASREARCSLAHARNDARTSSRLEG